MGQQAEGGEGKETEENTGHLHPDHEPLLHGSVSPLNETPGISSLLYASAMEMQPLVMGMIVTWVNI